MQVTPVPCLRDNYAYLLHQEGSAQAVVVDPSEAGPVEQALLAAGLELSAILNTHHHWDHVGGNEELLQKHAGLRVFAHASDRRRVPGQTEFLEDGSDIEVAGLAFSIRHIPGHTRGAIAYIGGGAAFTGDTLFAAGCGRLFEGTPRDMYESLNVKLGALPGATRIYCGHEYTENNLRFAASVEPGNADITARQAEIAACRRRGEPSVPFTIDDERRTNPFMRTESPAIRARFGGDSAASHEVLGKLRAAKDRF